MDNKYNNEIHNLIYSHEIIAFIKGNKLKPMCEFSNIVIQILNKFNIDYYTVDVLKNKKIRENIKIYSEWPTIPQVYINREFIGGSDILLDLYNTYKLHEILEKFINS